MPHSLPLCLQQVPQMEDTGWTRDAVYNWANALSMGRLLSGPAIAYMIMHGMWAPAVGTLAVAGGAPQSAVACLSHIQAWPCPDVWPAAAATTLRPASVCMVMHGLCRHWHLLAGFQAQFRTCLWCLGLTTCSMMHAHCQRVTSAARAHRRYESHERY